MRHVIRVTIALCSLALSAAISATPSLRHASNANIRMAAQPHTATTASTPQTVLNLTVQTPAGPLNLQLQRASALTAQASSWVNAIRDGQTRIYRGSVVDQPDSWVRMTRINGAWLGAIRTDDQLWLLDPARDHPQLASAKVAGRDGTLVFTYDDIAGAQQIDFGGVLSPPGALPHKAAPTVDSVPTTHANTAASYHLGVSLVLDTEFQAKYGANAPSTAVGILNIVDGFYSAQVSTEIYLVALKFLPGNGTLTSTDPSKLLNAFSAYMGNVNGAPIAFSGLAHLFSGKNFDGNVIGEAWLGTLCSRNYGYGVDQATFSAAGSAALVAHEMGHNYGASHDSDGNTCAKSGNIMGAVLNIGNPPTQFSTCSLTYFSQYRTNNKPQCLAARPDPIFRNGFE